MRLWLGLNETNRIPCAEQKCQTQVGEGRLDPLLLQIADVVS